MIEGVHQLQREYHDDDRGWLCEIFRKSWIPDIDAVQVNVMQSKAGVLRGSHVHREHSDVFFMAKGEAFVGVKDIRQHSPTFGMSDLLTFRSGAVVMPPGVIHGVYFPVDSILVTVESMYYDPHEELKVDWMDKELGIPWPFKEAVYPTHDRETLGYKALLEKVEPWQDTYWKK